MLCLLLCDTEVAKNFSKHNLENINCISKFVKFDYIKIKHFCGYAIRSPGPREKSWVNALMTGPAELPTRSQCQLTASHLFLDGAMWIRKPPWSGSSGSSNLADATAINTNYPAKSFLNSWPTKYKETKWLFQVLR